ncbi:MAG: hypothetical protein K1X40_14340, partial [Chitinophagales bacterium]|nr:hypothetical protein [Chitinophagales bacterium]
MKALPFLLLVTGTILTNVIFAQMTTVSSDKEWEKQEVFLKNTMEAEYIIRLGDVDNLGFGWPEGFDPFCGRMTDSHAYPWEPQAND